MMKIMGPFPVQASGGSRIPNTAARDSALWIKSLPLGLNFGDDNRIVKAAPHSFMRRRRMEDDNVVSGCWWAYLVNPPSSIHISGSSWYDLIPMLSHGCAGDFRSFCPAI